MSLRGRWLEWGWMPSWPAAWTLISETLGLLLAPPPSFSLSFWLRLSQFETLDCAPLGVSQ